MLPVPSVFWPERVLSLKIKLETVSLSGKVARHIDKI